MKNMFYVPTDKTELQNLVQEIIERNPGNMDLTYMMVLASEYTEKWGNK